MDFEAEDDFFGAGPSTPRGPGGTADPLAINEYDRLAQRYSDAGYREGITSGKLLTLQEGFDQGFALSVPLSRRLGRLRGRAAALLAWQKTKGKRRSVKADQVDQPVPAEHGEAVDGLKDLISDLGRVRRDLLLPRDEEAEAHEREHGDLAPPRQGGSVEMERLEMGLDGLGHDNHGGRQRGDALLASLEERLQQLEQRLRI